MIVWLNGTHGVGKTTTSSLVQQMIPGSRVFDAEMVGQMLMNIERGLPETDNFQHWPPWRPLVVETARRLVEYTGGTLVVPMTVLVEPYWREISMGLADYRIPVRHFVLHADQDTLRERIDGDTVMGPSTFRLGYLDAYSKAARSWLHDDAEVVDTTYLTPDEVARRIVIAVDRGHAMSEEVVLTGQLICSTDDEVAIVEAHLPRHIDLTRAEPGCISFEVRQTDDRHVWQVDERFVDGAAFDSHRARTAASEWGHATAGIERRYSVDSRFDD